MDFKKLDLKVRNLRPEDTRYDVALGNSVVVRVAATGGKSFVLKVLIGGKQQRLALGSYPATGVRAAFDKAEALRSQVRDGLDPRVAERRKAQGTEAPRTVAEAAERYVSEHLRVKNSASWATEAERMLRRDVLPKLGLYPLVQLKRADLSALISKKAADLKAAKRRGTAANRLRAVLSKFCGFCEEQGWLDEGLGVRLPRPVVEKTRDRILTAKEVGGLWNALQEVRMGHGAIDRAYGDILAILLLTGARCSEITRRIAGDLDSNAGILTISEGKTDASRRTLPLPPLARGILERAAQGKKADELLFALPKAGSVVPSNEVSRATRRLVKLLGHAPYTPHDLRRTAISAMAEAGVDADIRRRVTGHLAADVHGRVYDRALRLADMKAALTVIESWVSSAAAEAVTAGEKDGNIVKFKATAGQG